MPTISICKLRDIGIIRNDGTLADYSYNEAQTVYIVQILRKVLENNNIDEYLRRPGYTAYPECVVRQILRRYKGKIQENDE